MDEIEISVPRLDDPAWMAGFRHATSQAAQHIAGIGASMAGLVAFGAENDEQMKRGEVVIEILAELSGDVQKLAPEEAPLWSADHA